MFYAIIILKGGDQMKLLLAEDEKRMASALVELLRLEKYDVDHFADGASALAALESNVYDAAIIDVMMPEKNDFEVVRAARGKGVKTPVLMLTAKSGLDNNVTGLDSGADDYLTKPFQTRELLARVRALCRRNIRSQDGSLCFGDLALDTTTATLTCRKTGQSVRLGEKELRIMEYMIANQGQILTREQLAVKIWGLESDAEYNNVEVYGTAKKRIKRDAPLYGSRADVANGSTIPLCSRRQRSAADRFLLTYVNNGAIIQCRKGMKPMPRPTRCRQIGQLPMYRSFSPDDMEVTDTVAMTVDEYEVIRLLDHEGLNQEECASRMNVSRTTVTAIYESARTKMADMLVNGRRLLIVGGNYRFPPADIPQALKNKGDHVMRIAVTYENGEVFQHFGHSEQFKLYDVEDGKIIKEQIVDTNGSGHGLLAGFLQTAKVDALICGGIGMGAQMALADAGIKLYAGVQGSADEAAQALAGGNLAYDPNARCDHHEHHDGDCGHDHCAEHHCAGN